MSTTFLLTSICLKSMYWRSKIGSTPHDCLGFGPSVISYQWKGLADFVDIRVWISKIVRES
jgi:hypothetical protein